MSSGEEGRSLEEEHMRSEGGERSSEGDHLSAEEKYLSSEGKYTNSGEPGGAGGESRSAGEDIRTPASSPERDRPRPVRDTMDDSQWTAMKQQFPLFKAMTARHFFAGSLTEYLKSILEIGISIFLMASFIALLMENQSTTDHWENATKWYWFGFISCCLLIVPLIFTSNINIEINQGTFKSLCLYPIGINLIISSKIAMVAIGIGGGMCVVAFASLTPFLVIGIISWTYASRLLVIAFLMFMAFLLTTTTGAFYGNIIAANHRFQNISNYSTTAIASGILLTFMPVRLFSGLIFALFDPNDRFLGDPQAEYLAEVLSRFSPFEWAYQWSNTFIFGGTWDLSYGICIPVWLFIAFLGIRAGPRVYMDIFFRRS